jgi:hypothetical protein
MSAESKDFIGFFKEELDAWRSNHRSSRRAAMAIGLCPQQWHMFTRENGAQSPALMTLINMHLASKGEFDIVSLLERFIEHAQSRDMGHA